MPNETLSDILLHRAAETPDGKYILFEDHWLTYQDVVRASERVAAGLHRLGVNAGDRVALLLPNCKDYVFAYFACNRLGAIMVPLNTYLRGSFLSYQLVESQASMLIADPQGYEQARAVLSELPDLKEIVVTDEVAERPPAGVRLTPFAEVLACTDAIDLPRRSAKEISGIIFTSGTTGLPKGCLVSHGFCLAIAQALFDHGYFAVGDRVITSWPIFHMGGYVYCLGTPLVGAGSLVLETHFSASRMLARARQTEATVLYAFGMMALAMLAQPEKPDDRDNSLRFAFILPCKPKIQEEFKARFGLEDVSAELYGQTEYVPVTLRALDGRRNPESAGLETESFEVRIGDPDDNILPPGEIGEILIRPKRPNVAYSGYWNNPQATLEAGRNLWHHTGDLGRMDADGYLYFVDRKKDAIRRRSEYVSSLELELALLKHPDISVAAVHAVPSELTEDEIKVWIIPAEGRDIEPQGLFDFCKQVLPYYAMPRFVEVVRELPTNVNFRVLKHELKRLPNSETTWDMEKMGFVVSREERRG